MVFDDSWSMGSGDKWAAANYAVQAMAALMNKEDDLYIIMMNKMDHPIDVNLADPSAAVQEIRTKCLCEEKNGTPGVSVDKAMEVLSSVDDQDPSTQYWLFIITDGILQDENGNNPEMASQKVDKYKGTVMPNGSTVKIDYLKIESEENGEVASDEGEVASDEKAGVWSYKSDPEEITESVSEIAN